MECLCVVPLLHSIATASAKIGLDLRSISSTLPLSLVFSSDFSASIRLR